MSKRQLSPSTGQDSADKKAKRQWHNRKGRNSEHLTIEPGDAGIFATCPRNKEKKCVGELGDLLKDYASQLYGDYEAPTTSGNDIDILAGVAAELIGMQQPETEPIFSNISLNISCVVFFKTRKPVDPVELVEKICEDLSATGKHRTRFTLRLSPMSVMGHASEIGLVDVAQKALARHFHTGDSGTKKFAIRPSLRHIDPAITRDMVIKRVAEVVGENHKVDLTNYDICILVEMYKSICGIAVVSANYDKLKRYNLAEIHAPGYETGAALPSASEKG